MGWFGGMITLKSQECPQQLDDYRVRPEDQSAGSMKLPLDSYRTDASAPVGSCWVLPQPTGKRQRRARREWQAESYQRGDPETGHRATRRSMVGGGKLTHIVRDVHHVKLSDRSGCGVVQCHGSFLVVGRGQHGLSSLLFRRTSSHRKM